MLEPERRPPKTPTFPDPLNSGKGLIEVGDQVFHVFDSYRQAHQPLCDADLHLNIRRNGRVSHQRRQGYEGLDAAQAFSERAELHVIEEIFGRVE